MILTSYESESSLAVFPPMFAQECGGHPLSVILEKTSRLLGIQVTQINSALDEIDVTVSGIAGFEEEQSIEDSRHSPHTQVAA